MIVVTSSHCGTELCAALKSADAAALSAYWDGATFWTAIGGVIASLLTLFAAVAAAKFAKDAAKETKRSADAAFEAAQLSERALAHTIAADRPWIVLDEVVSGRRHDPCNSSSFFGVIITIKIANCGTRPAVNGAIEWEYHIYNDTGCLPRIKLFADPVVEGGFLLGPGKTHNSEIIKIDMIDSEEILNQEKSLIVAFRISYEGAAKTNYITQGIIRMRSLMPASLAKQTRDSAVLAPDIVGGIMAT